jgi:hypothetical protein
VSPHCITPLGHLQAPSSQIWPNGQHLPLQQGRLNPQQSVPHLSASVQHRPADRSTQIGARSPQHLPPVGDWEQYFSSGQHGPSSELIPVPSERSPGGQQRTSPVVVNHCRSGGQHSEGAASLPMGLPQRFGDGQQEPVPGPGLQHSDPLAQHTSRSSSQQNCPEAHVAAPHGSGGSFRFFFRFFRRRASPSASPSRPTGPATASNRSAPRRGTRPPNPRTNASKRSPSTAHPRPVAVPPQFARGTYHTTKETATL